MIPQDIVQRVVKRHDNAIDAAQTWAIAWAKHHKTDTAHTRYVRAEQKFESAMAALVDAANKRSR
jgi:hypothetical protein